jgi:hypothetical protein
MRNVNPYQGCAQRTLRQALIHLLEHQYGLLGSRRVLELLADDTEALIAQHYPPPERLTSGWMVFTATRANGTRPPMGGRAGDYDLITLSWPVITPDDLETLRTLPSGKAGQQVRKHLCKQRIQRLIEHGLSHPDGPALLTQADLSLMVGITPGHVCRHLQELRRETGKSLPTMGYFYDLGMRPTHKGEVIALYEAGQDEGDIARRTGHSQTSVGHYIRDYERVKLLLAHHTPPADVPTLANLIPTVAREHINLAHQYHPELVPQLTAHE